MNQHRIGVACTPHAALRAALCALDTPLPFSFFVALLRPSPPECFGTFSGKKDTGEREQHQKVAASFCIVLANFQDIILLLFSSSVRLS